MNGTEPVEAGRREVLFAAASAIATLPGVALAQASATVSSSPAPAASPPVSAAIAARAVQSVQEPILRISREVWKNAERTLTEEKAAAIHVRELQSAGF